MVKSTKYRSFEARSAPLACSRCLKLFELEVELSLSEPSLPILSTVRLILASTAPPSLAMPGPTPVRSGVREWSDVEIRCLTDPEF